MIYLVIYDQGLALEKIEKVAESIQPVDWDEDKTIIICNDMLDEIQPVTSHKFDKLGITYSEEGVVFVSFKLHFDVEQSSLTFRHLLNL